MWQSKPKGESRQMSRFIGICFFYLYPEKYRCYRQKKPVKREQKAEEVIKP